MNQGNSAEPTAIMPRPDDKFVVNIELPLGRPLNDRDVQPVLVNIARVCNFIVANILAEAANTEDLRATGAGHQTIQALFACAAQADVAARSLQGQQNQILRPGMMIPPGAQRRPS